MRTATLALVMAVAASVATGAARQSLAGDELRFEAATIKPVSELQRGAGPRGLDLFSRNYITLQQLLIYAYERPAYRIVGGPSWVTTDHFDVQAKAGAPPTAPQMHLLVQRLLADRFGLRVHRETRELPIYDLVFARADHRLGPKLNVAAIDCTPFQNGQRPMAESPTVTVDGHERPRCMSGITFGAGVSSPFLDGVPIVRLTEQLERSLNRPVIDKTGLTGVFDIELKFADESLPPAFRGTQPPDAPALLTAVTEQLGLKLESSKGPVELLVIDAVQHPSEN
jgi:uncharacterized protein (TIGR03435 family)